MAWDKLKIGQKFFKQAHAVHPEDEDNVEQRVKALALQDVYYDCYMSSFTKEDLIKRLHAVLDGKIEMPEEEVDEQLYRETYIKHANAVLSSLEAGKFD